MTTQAFGQFQPNDFFNQFGTDFFSGTPSLFGFEDFLEEEPNIAFQGALGRANLPFSQREQFQRQRQDIFNRFQGVQRFDPSQRFTPFIDAFDFNRERFRTPLGQRGESFQPRTTFVR